MFDILYIADSNAKNLQMIPSEIEISNLAFLAIQILSKTLRALRFSSPILVKFLLSYDK